MRKQIITWYTPEEKTPDNGEPIFINSLNRNGQYYNGIYREYYCSHDGVDYDEIGTIDIKEWCYMNV